jgi:hypothetical protein
LLQANDDLFEQVEIEPASFDFGEVSQAEELTHLFRFKNTGQEAVEIVHIHSSCGCATAEGIVGRVVEAGTTLEVPVTLRTGSSDGLRSGRISFYYRGPEERIPAWKSITVTSAVVTDYRLHPPFLDFGSVDHQKPITRTVWMEPNRVPDVEIAGAESGHPAFAVQLPSSQPKGPNRAVEVTFNPVAVSRNGPISTVLTVRTTSQRVPLTRVLLQASIESPVEVTPTAIVVGADIVGAVEREILIRARRPVRVDARCPDPHVLLPFLAGQYELEHRLRLSVPENDNGSDLNTKVEIDIGTDTDGGVPQSWTFTVPVHRLYSLRKGGTTQ